MSHSDDSPHARQPRSRPASCSLRRTRCGATRARIGDRSRRYGAGLRGADSVPGLPPRSFRRGPLAGRRVGCRRPNRWDSDTRPRPGPTPGSLNSTRTRARFRHRHALAAISAGGRLAAASPLAGYGRDGGRRGVAPQRVGGASSSSPNRGRPSHGGARPPGFRRVRSGPETRHESRSALIRAVGVIACREAR